MLNFKHIEIDEVYDNCYIFLYEYFHHNTNNNDSDYFYNEIPFIKEKTVATKIEDIYESIYSLGEELYEYMKNDEHFDIEYLFYKVSKLEHIEGIKFGIDYWVQKNGYPYFRGFEYYGKNRTNKLDLNIGLFSKDVVNLYILSRTHELIHEIESLSSRNPDYENKYDNVINDLLDELNEYIDWYLIYGVLILKTIHTTSAISTFKEWLKEMDLIFEEKDKYKINLEFLMPVITEMKENEDNYLLDISLLNTRIDMSNFEDVIGVINGLSLLYTYKLKHYVKGQEFYYPFGISDTYYQSFNIDYEQIVFDKDIRIYKNFIMGYSLIGVSYYKLLLNLTTNYEYGGVKMIKCANPNCKRYFQQNGRQEYCKTKECQRYRKNKKSNEYYYRNKKEDSN